jgi:hypothetical protein
MADETVPVWPRPYFKRGEAKTELFFVCFGRAPLAELDLDRQRFGLPSREVLDRVDLREHQRAASAAWFEGWWSSSFGAIARRDLGEELSVLTSTDVCYTLTLKLEDQPDLAPQQTIWALVRWLCERGASIVLDVHAFRFRTRAEVSALSFEGSDVQRDVKLVFENQPTLDGMHLLHTRGLCKFARPELLCYVHPDDFDVAGRLLNQVARTLMEGAAPSQIHLRPAEGLELTATGGADSRLVESLGLLSAVMLTRAGGAALAGIARQVPAT